MIVSELCVREIERMPNFIQDNKDLQFYLHHWIDWDTLFELTEFRSPDSDPDMPSNAEEAAEVWRDILYMIGELAGNEIAPYASELDREGVSLNQGEVRSPDRLNSIFETLAELGLHGLSVPRELGGLNNPLISYFIQGELISRADVSVMAHHSFHGGMALAMIMYSADEGSLDFDVENMRIIKTRFDQEISEIIRGESWGCMDITEPNAGSDMGALRTRAEQDESGQWYLTGEKIFITSGHGRYHFVICRTEPVDLESDPTGLKGLSLFMAETYHISEDGTRERRAQVQGIEDKMGHHASATVSLYFDRTPAQLIGRQGDGFRQMLLLMNNARIGVGFEALGLCESAWRMAKAYASERTSMGKTIDQHELVAQMLDEMRTSIEGLRALCMRVAFLNEKLVKKQLMYTFLMGQPDLDLDSLNAEISSLKQETRTLTPLVKLNGSETAVKLARMSIQIHGGVGYTREYGAEKLLRDALVLPIYEGTTQIQALMATKDNLLAVMRSPGRFVSQLMVSGFKRWFSLDRLERRVWSLKRASLLAMRSLMYQVIKSKWTQTRRDPQAKLMRSFKRWDPKVDFSPALLHAEHLSWILSDAITAEALWAQAQKYPERREPLTRFLDLAEPRVRDRLYRIQTCGDRLLQQLQDDRAHLQDSISTSTTEAL